MIKLHNTIEIQSGFIDKFINCASHTYIIVYIMLLRHGGSSIDTVEIADFLNMTEGDIKRAIGYWVSKGAILADEVADSSVFNIKFLDCTGAPQQNNTEHTCGTTTEEVIQDEIVDEDDADESAEIIVSQRLVTERRPVYSSKEIGFYMQNSVEIRTLFKRCEGYLGKLLTHNDLSTIFSLHDWLRLPIDVIDMLISYCSSNDKRSLRYIEKTAIAWADAGINTKEKAAAQIKLYNGDFRSIMKELGKAHRDPIKKEEEYMLKWLKTYKIPLEVVLAACTKTVMQAQRPTFKYADGILEKWQTKGITTIEDIEKDDDEFKQAKAANSEGEGEMKNGSKAGAKRKPRSKFANFKERDDIDFEEMRKLEMERIDRELGIK